LKTKSNKTITKSVSSLPQNDRCEGALDLGSFTYGQSLTLSTQSNLAATFDSNESPWCGVDTQRGVWYKLTIPNPAEVTVSTCYQANFETQIVVYSGVCGSLMCKIGAGGPGGCDQTIVFDDSTSNNIYIRVEGYGGDTGNFDMTVLVSSIISVRSNN